MWHFLAIYIEPFSTMIIFIDNTDFWYADYAHYWAMKTAEAIYL